MRELIFKNLVTPASRKRDISVEEVVSQNGITSITKKRSMYFVTGVHKISSREDMEGWVANRKKDPTYNKKFFHILRRYSTENQEDMLICKMRGSFYIIADNSVYNIVFVHAIKIKINKPE